VFQSQGLLNIKSFAHPLLFASARIFLGLIPPSVLA
jgi:hypothetical protein